MVRPKITWETGWSHLKGSTALNGSKGAEMRSFLEPFLCCLSPLQNSREKLAPHNNPTTMSTNHRVNSLMLPQVRSPSPPRTECTERPAQPRQREHPLPHPLFPAACSISELSHAGELLRCCPPTCAQPTYQQLPPRLFRDGLGRSAAAQRCRAYHSDCGPTLPSHRDPAPTGWRSRKLNHLPPPAVRGAERARGRARQGRWRDRSDGAP